MADIRTISRVLDGEHVISEANGRRSRESGILDVTAVKVPPGTVLGKLTANGRYVPLLPGAATGAETAAAVLFAGKPVSTGVQKCVVHDKDCEINVNKVTWPAGISGGDKTAAIAALATKGCLLRA